MTIEQELLYLNLRNYNIVLTILIAKNIEFISDDDKHCIYIRKNEQNKKNIVLLDTMITDMIKKDEEFYLKNK